MAGPSTATRLRAVTCAVLAALVLAGCGVRLDSPPPSVPVADATEEVRQGAAQDAADLHAAARSARTSATDPDVTAALIAVETAATEHHAALGGVWEPWDGAGPEATAYPGTAGPTPSPTPSVDPAGVLDLLEEAAAGAHDAALAGGGDLGQLLAAVAISRDQLAVDLAAALSTSPRTLPAAPLPAPEAGTVAPETSRSLDAARYAMEVVAARSAEPQRDLALRRAEALAAVAGAVAPEEDEREVAYDITGPSGAQDPERALAAAAELDVLRAYIALLGTAVADREAVLAAAVDAAQQARSWDSALPALPGLS